MARTMSQNGTGDYSVFFVVVIWMLVCGAVLLERMNRSVPTDSRESIGLTSRDVSRP